MGPPASTPHERPTHIRYWVLGGFCAAASIAYLQRYAINRLAPSMQQELRLDKDQMGSVMSGFFAGYALTSIPFGWLGDRWGSRKALTLFALTWSAATALVGWTRGLNDLVCVWTLAGAAQAGLFPCAMIALRNWLPATRRAVASGMLATFMNVGAVLAPLVAAGLKDRLGYSWREVFVWISIPGFVWAAWYFWWYRDRPADHPSVNRAERMLIGEGSQSDASSPLAIRSLGVRLLLNYRMWLICAQQFLRAAAQVFFGTWFGTFLEESPGIARSQVAVLTSVPPALLIVGSMVGGIFCDWLLYRTGSRRVSRQGLAVVNLILCAAMFAGAAQAENDYLRVGLISAACFFMTVGGVSAYAITMDLGGPYVATVFSTMNMSGSIGAALFPKLAGRMVQASGHWNDVLWLIAGIYVAAAICWALLNPNGTLFDDAAR